MQFDTSKIPNLQQRQQLATYLDKLSQIDDEIKARTSDLRAKRADVLGELLASGIHFEKIITSPTRRRCAVSGLPLLDGDETLWDDETEEVMLRCLVLPPRLVQDKYPDDIDVVPDTARNASVSVNVDKCGCGECGEVQL